MRKCHVRIEDQHFQEMHHALGCPWPNEVMGETYRNYFAAGIGSDEAKRMSASDHWTDGQEKFGHVYYYVSDKGKRALSSFMRENVETPARYMLTFHHHEGCTIVPARSRSAARYAAYRSADIDWPFMEYAAEIKSIRLHSAANTI